MKFRRKIIALSISSSLALSGCASIDNTVNTISNYSGTLIGCAAGAGLGYAAKGNKGAVVGAVLGCSAGYLWDRRQMQIRAAAEEQNMAVAFEDEQLSLPVPKGKPAVEGRLQSANIASEQMFQSGSSTLTPEAEEVFRQMAEGYKDKPETRLMVVGHADASGSESVNQQLSEKRAKAVADYLAKRGVSEDRLYFQGAGESQPVASNETAEGRVLNRRVEVVELLSSDTATTGQQEQVLLAYSRKKQADLRNIQTHSPLVLKNDSTQQEEVQSSTEIEQAATSIDLIEESETADVVKAKALVDFGGKAVNQKSDLYALLGEPKKGLTFSMFNTAYADDDGARLSCLEDQPRVSGDVKSLSSGKAVKPSTSAYVRGMNKSVWVSKVNNHMVALSPVAVLEDGLIPSADPRIKVYKNFSGGSGVTADYQQAAKVNVYDGDNALLYRVFSSDKSAPVQCIDVILPKSGTPVAKAGELFYLQGKNEMVAEYRPQHYNKK